MKGVWAKVVGFSCSKQIGIKNADKLYFTSGQTLLISMGSFNMSIALHYDGTLFKTREIEAARYAKPLLPLEQYLFLKRISKSPLVRRWVPVLRATPRSMLGAAPRSRPRALLALLFIWRGLSSPGFKNWRKFIHLLFKVLDSSRVFHDFAVHLFRLFLLSLSSSPRTFVVLTPPYREPQLRRGMTDATRKILRCGWWPIARRSWSRRLACHCVAILISSWRPSGSILIWSRRISWSRRSCAWIRLAWCCRSPLRCRWRVLRTLPSLLPLSGRVGWHTNRFTFL